MNLGLLYELGEEMKADKDEAIKHYEIAAGQGYWKARRRLASLYQNKEELQ